MKKGAKRTNWKKWKRKRKRAAIDADEVTTTIKRAAVAREQTSLDGAVAFEPAWLWLVLQSWISLTLAAVAAVLMWSEPVDDCADVDAVLVDNAAGDL